MPLHTARCRDCGAEGWEDPETDLMPDTCPRCFELRIRPVFRRARSLPTLIDGLIEVGCNPDRVRVFITELAALRGFELPPKEG